MVKKVTSIIIIVSLSLSIVFGGLGLSLRSAEAHYDTTGYSIVDLLVLLDEVYNVPVNSSVYSNVYSHIQSLDLNGSAFICVAINGNSFAITTWQENVFSGIINGPYAVDGFWYRTSNNREYYTHNLRPTWYAFGGFGSGNDALRISSNTFANNTSLDVSTFTLDNSQYTSDHTKFLAYPSSSNMSSTWDIYFNQDVYSSQSISTVAYEKNLFELPPEPETIDYEILVFWLGTRRYFTVTDQSIMRQLNGNGQQEYVLSIESAPDIDSEDFTLISIQYDDLALLSYSGVESQLSNISPAGVYAYDITSLDWYEIYDSTLFDINDIENIEVIGGATNCPYVLQEEAPEPGTNGTGDTYINSWSTFIEYINNYDSTQIVPENLVDTIFGVNGFKLYPVDVSLPSSTIPTNNPYTPDIHTYKFHFSALPNNLGLNYDLMDVCIIPKTFTGNYGLVFFYDDTLAAANKFVDYVDYKDLLDQFDIIIVVDDTLEALQENAWWEIIVPNDVWSHVDYMAVSGSSSMGIQYTSDSLPGNVESGFCIITKRAIQRQQLYLFNDGITKTYKLMSDFVEKHGLWENSFFEWSQSIFYELQTIGGKTNDIYNLLVSLNLGDVLDNISRQLERIADNTSEEDPGYWFLSLWNFVSRFSVSDLDFANWVEDYDDFESQIPLPNEDVTPIPIPTITSEVG